MASLYYPERYFTTTLSSDITSSTTTIPLTTVPSDVTTGYMVIEPASATKREVIHFTSVGASSVTAADDTTDASDASGRGCAGSITAGANTEHSQGATVIIAAVEQYWKRLYDKLTAADSDGIQLTEINDSNGNEEIKFTATGSAVNEITVANAATGNDPAITATGGDTNIDLEIAGKGTGTVKRPSSVTLPVTAYGTDIATGDGKAYVDIPKEIDGYVLKSVFAAFDPANPPTGSTASIMVHNDTQNVDMLSTAITVDASEATSATAATPAVIDAANDDVTANDRVRIDVDQVGSTNAGQGLAVTLQFTKS